MAITIKLRSGGLEPSPELTFDAPRVVIGRAGGSELWLPDPSVSHRHASLRQRGSSYVLVDEGSENGSFCGDVRLASAAPQPLSDGDLVRLGRVWVEIRLGPSSGSADAKASRALARRLVEHALQLEGAPTGLCVSLGTGEPQARLPLTRERHRYCVGSGVGADLRLPDASLPERCLELTRKLERVWVTRLAGCCTAELGGNELAEAERTVWPPGVPLTLGKLVLSQQDLTAQVLEKLEREPTELLRDGEPIDPPDCTEPEAAAADEEEDPSLAHAREPSPALTEARPPSPAARPSLRGRPRSRIELADALIFAFGLCVLGSSLWAIRWLADLGV